MTKIICVDCHKLFDTREEAIKHVWPRLGKNSTVRVQIRHNIFPVRFDEPTPQAQEAVEP